MPFAAAHKAEIYYELLGEGSALVFAHGRGGNGASWWQQVPAFARDHQVVLFDHRCFGRSRCASEDFDRVRFGADLIAVLDAAGITRAAIVCQSMGGWTGLQVALAAPERVRALVLSSTPAAVDLPVVRQALAEARKTFAAEGLGRAALALDFPERRPELALLYSQIDSLNGQIPEALAFGEEGWIAPAAIEGFAVPTLFLTGELDRVLPPPVIKAVADLMPHAEYHVLPGAGHSPYFETPGRFNNAVAQFLDRHPS